MKTNENDLATVNGEPPGSIRKPPWQNVPDSDWFNWRWQLSHSITDIRELQYLLHLSTQEIKAIDAPRLFKFGITPYFTNLIDPWNENCPIRRQVIPRIEEIMIATDEIVDSLGEEDHSPIPGLVHRYPDRVLMLVNTQCASYCRFCTRSRLVGDPHNQYNGKSYQMQIDYIAANPAIRDVLLSGGDPLILPLKVLESILKRLHDIPHVEVIRIGTRVPIFLPMRIDQELCHTLRKYHPLWMNIHVNHPQEITAESKQALSMLSDSGIPLGSQTVLLAGINDCPQVMKSLFLTLVQNRVRPYYLYQCDQVPGSSHFRTSIGTGMEIMENLRGHTSGFAIPTYVIDAPAGGGKIPILPQYLISYSDSTAVVRNYEGMITAYHQPRNYQAHDSRSCPQCQAVGQSGQAGISAVLAGGVNAITPQDWRDSHQRSIPLPDVLQPAFNLVEETSRQENLNRIIVPSKKGKRSFHDQSR
jgi:lysine 2,3-aminomutase